MPRLRSNSAGCGRLVPMRSKRTLGQRHRSKRSTGSAFEAPSAEGTIDTVFVALAVVHAARRIFDFSGSA